MLHTAILFGCFISYFPYSFIGLPAITTVLIATVHALICENSLTLLPFYIYLLFIIIFCAILGVTVFVFTIINPHFLLLQLGYPNLDSLILKILLFFSVKVTIFTILAIIWWQADIIYKCRQYFDDKRDQNNYMHLSVPESFIDTKIAETLPITVGLKVPEYVFYSLEEEIEHEEQNTEKEKEKEKEEKDSNINKE
uniref:NADH dehydrogenase subunit 6 n=1 Tax=Panagrolaimus sp. PS1159 TaxID=55785 RepID=A0AC35G4P4_9BILA